MMMSTRTITLFTAPMPARSGPSPLIISVLFHGTVLGLIYFGLKEVTRVDDRLYTERYTLRLLELHPTKPEKPRQAGGHVAYPGARASASPPGPPAAGHEGRSGPSSSAPPSLPGQLAHLQQASQTLVQRDLPPDVAPPRDTPVPAALLWSPEKSRIENLIPPSQQNTMPADAPPSLDLPNRELNVADLKVSATDSVTVKPAPSPTTTSPLSALQTQPARKIPQMASNTAAQPTPATVISISELQMKDGAIPLPPVNETAAANSTGLFFSGNKESKALAGSGDSSGSASTAGSGQGTGQGDRHTAEVAPAGSGGASGGAGGASGSGTGAASGDGSSVTRVTQPRNGQFGVVVVGSSLQDQYPDTLGLWGDRLTYTVYIHSGLNKNWIMQYAMPRASGAAKNVRPAAPWPYYIVVPHIASQEISTDAIMVHGFVNTEGRFEQLAIVSPPDFRRKDFVLNALQEWQFRPAMQDRQVTAVEILLIIPDDLD
jgi:hypothetical protein